MDCVRGFASIAAAVDRMNNSNIGAEDGSVPNDNVGDALVLEINRDARDGMALSAIVCGEGMLRVGDHFVCGPLSGCVRACVWWRVVTWRDVLWRGVVWCGVRFGSAAASSPVLFVTVDGATHFFPCSRTPQNAPDD